MAENVNNLDWGQQITKQMVTTYFTNWINLKENTKQSAAETLFKLYKDDTTSIFLEKPHQIKATGGQNILQGIHGKLGTFQFDGQQLTMDMADVMGDDNQRIFHVQLVGKFQWQNQNRANIPNGWQNFSLSWVCYVSKEQNVVSGKILGEIWKPVVQYSNNFKPVVQCDGDIANFFQQVVTKFYTLWKSNDFKTMLGFYNQNSKAKHGDKSDTHVGHQNILQKMHSYGRMAFDMNKMTFDAVKAYSNKNTHFFLVNIVGMFQMGDQSNAMFFTQSWMVQLNGNQPVILNDFFKPVY